MRFLWMPRMLLLSVLAYGTSCNQQKPTEVSAIAPPDTVALRGPATITRTVLQDRQGNIWMAAFDGVFRYDGKLFANMTNGVSPSRFFSAMEDSKGNVWFGSIGTGVYRYDGASFENFTTDDGLLNNEIVSIHEDRRGNLWFGSFGGASRYDGKSFRHYVLEGESMREDRAGNTFRNAPRAQYEVNAIVEDQAGKIWLATRGNTFVYDGQNFSVVAHDDKPFRNVRTIIEDREGQIWLGGQDGLWRYDGSKFVNYSTNFTGYIYEDRSGALWTSTADDTGKSWVLSRYDDKSSSTSVIIRGNEKMIFGIVEATDGHIWFGTLSGVRRYDGNSVTDFKNK